MGGASTATAQSCQGRRDEVVRETDTTRVWSASQEFYISSTTEEKIGKVFERFRKQSSSIANNLRLSYVWLRLRIPKTSFDGRFVYGIYLFSWLSGIGPM